MPHERGSMPVPPSGFSITALADPKTRFCRSLANRQLAPTLSRYLVDTKQLIRKTQTADRALGSTPTRGCFSTAQLVLKTHHPAPLHSLVKPG
jgi:hypothetical protein